MPRAAAPKPAPSAARLPAGRGTTHAAVPAGRTQDATAFRSTRSRCALQRVADENDRYDVVPSAGCHRMASAHWAHFLLPSRSYALGIAVDTGRHC